MCDPIWHVSFVAVRQHGCQLLRLLARDVIYTSRAYAMMPVRLYVTEVHWRIIANLGFKFRSHFTAHWPPCCCGRRAARRAVWGESSRAMLASARLSSTLRTDFTSPVRPQSVSVW